MKRFPYLLASAIILALAYFLIMAPEEVSDKAVHTASAASASSAPTASASSASTAKEPAPLALGAAYDIPAITAPRPEQLIHHIGYAVSYNPEWRIPNWVAYELTADETIGAEERTNHFRPDPLVEGDAVVTKDYSNSGFDRGHMAPAADMRWSEQAMRESFYMTNICPQNHNLNAGDWKTLEEKVRSWANAFDHVYVCCGPLVADTCRTIGQERKIKVPYAFYKAILTERQGQWHSIAFVMSNKPGHRKLSTYALTVDSVENLTGIDFFYSLPDSLESLAESSFDLSLWGVK